jgi:hypothetical protein
MTIQQLVAELEDSAISTPWSEIQRRYQAIETDWRSMTVSALDTSPKYAVATEEMVAALLPEIALQVESFLEGIEHVQRADILYEIQLRRNVQSRRVHGAIAKNYYAFAVIPIHWSFVSELLPGADRPLGLWTLRTFSALRGDRYPSLPESYSGYRGYTIDANVLPLAKSVATDTLDRYGLDPSFDVFISDDHALLVVSAIVRG